MTAVSAGLDLLSGYMLW